MTISDLDIWRSANLIITQLGVGAWMFAATKSRELAEAGDAERAVIWQRVAGAIAELEDVDCKGKAN
jgi:hypothetical protein